MLPASASSYNHWAVYLWCSISLSAARHLISYFNTQAQTSDLLLLFHKPCDLYKICSKSTRRCFTSFIHARLYSHCGPMQSLNKEIIVKLYWQLRNYANLPVRLFFFKYMSSNHDKLMKVLIRGEFSKLSVMCFYKTANQPKEKKRKRLCTTGIT